MSEVYRAQHPNLDCYVAIKILSKCHLEDGVVRRRFEHEARAISEMRHPNIVTLYEYNELDGTPFMVLEYLDGPNLSQMLKEKGRLHLAEALPLLKEIASALDYAHMLGIVHRDIKPSNVIIEQKANAMGEIKQRAVLTDFGIAKLYQSQTQLTNTGGLIGTLDYVSPEQIQGASEVGARSDIYSFAVMVYELLTGALPFEHKNPGAIVMAHLMQPPPDPRNYVQDLPAEVTAAILQAMSKDPQARQGTVGEMVKAMEHFETDPIERDLRQANEGLWGMA